MKNVFASLLVIGMFAIASCGGNSADVKDGSDTIKAVDTTKVDTTVAVADTVKVDTTKKAEAKK